MASLGLHGTLTCKMLFVHDFVIIAMQVCGLKWSPDDREIASGGNDNQLFIWNQHSDSPILRFGDHAAAVKAIAWSPHQHGLLASGGGTADRCIRFCNTATNSSLNCIDTGKAPCYYATLHDRFLHRRLQTRLQHCHNLIPEMQRHRQDFRLLLHIAWQNFAWSVRMLATGAGTILVLEQLRHRQSSRLHGHIAWLAVAYAAEFVAT